MLVYCYIKLLSLPSTQECEKRYIFFIVQAWEGQKMDVKRGHGIATGVFKTDDFSVIFGPL
jgi:hypothetical protein